jgi:hypothetical protein
VIDRVTKPRTARLPSGVKRATREWFSAAIRIENDNAVLLPRRGCTRIVLEIWPEEIVEKSTREPQRALTANIGDRLIVCGDTVDETQLVEVTRIDVDGWSARLHVRLGAGGPIRSASVNVIKAGRAA